MMKLQRIKRVNCFFILIIKYTWVYTCHEIRKHRKTRVSAITSRVWEFREGFLDLTVPLFVECKGFVSTLAFVGSANIYSGAGVQCVLEPTGVTQAGPSRCITLQNHTRNFAHTRMSVLDVKININK